MYSLICPNQGTPHHLSQAGFGHQEIYEQQISFAQLPPEYIYTPGAAVIVREQCTDRRENVFSFFSKKGRIYMKEISQILRVSSIVPSSLSKGFVLSKQSPAG